MENKVKEIYETAIIYLSLPITCRFILGSHFKIVRTSHLGLSNSSEMDELIFKEISKQDIFPEFKKMASAYQKSRTYDASAY